MLKKPNRWWDVPGMLFRAAGVGLVLWLAGCTTPGDGTQPAQMPFPIDTLVLISAPAAVNVDANPGPDGIAVRIFGWSETRARALPLESGTLEVLMFDGVINEQTPATAKPLHIWSETAAE